MMRALGSIPRDVRKKIQLFLFPNDKDTEKDYEGVEKHIRRCQKETYIIIIIFMHWKGTNRLAFALGNIVGALGRMPKDINFFNNLI